MYHVMTFEALKEEFFKLNKNNKKKENDFLLSNKDFESDMKKNLSLLEKRLNDITGFFTNNNFIVDFKKDTAFLEFKIKKNLILCLPNPYGYKEILMKPEFFQIRQEEEKMYDLELKYNFKLKSVTVRLYETNFLIPSDYVLEDKYIHELESILKIIEKGISKKIKEELNNFDFKSFKKKIEHFGMFVDANDLLSYKKQIDFQFLVKNRESLNLNALKESFDLLNLKYDLISPDYKTYELKRLNSL